jgi:hypothetical protein
MLSRDGIAALAVLAGCVALFVLTLGLAENPLVPIGPGFYPRLVLGVTACFAIAVIIADMRAAKRSIAAERVAAKPVRYRLVVALFAAFAVYAAALPYIGFRVGTFAFVAVVQAILDPPADARRWSRHIVIALATAAATYFVFEYYLHVLLPRGRWTGF